MSKGPLSGSAAGVLLAIALAVFAAVGCSQVGSKAHDLGSAFSGNYDTVVNASPTDAVAAARQAVRDVHLVFISAEKNPDDNSTAVIARNAQDERVTVTIVPEGATASRIVVSTGVFGNTTLRQQVMDAVRARLGPTTTQSAGPTTQAGSPQTKP